MLASDTRKEHTGSCHTCPSMPCAPPLLVLSSDELPRGDALSPVVASAVMSDPTPASGASPGGVSMSGKSSVRAALGSASTALAMATMS